MRLSALQASRVLTRKKSQHRVKSKTRTMKVGAILPIQVERAGKNPLTQEPEKRWVTQSHVRITAIYMHGMDEISDTEIKAEGFDTRKQFMEVWGSHKGCTVLCFEPVERERYPSAINRFDGEGRGYSSSPSGHDTLASVPDDTQARFSKEGREKDAERRGEAIEKEADLLRDQILTLKVWAAKNGLDARSELRVLERRLQEKLRRKAA